MEKDIFNKRKFVEEFHKSYIYTFMNTNLHCHSEMFKTLKLMTTTKMNEKDMLVAYNRIKHLILDNGFESIDGLSSLHEKRGEGQGQDKQDIMTFFEKEASLLIKLKDIISVRAYGILNIIYYNILRNVRFDIIMICLDTMLNMKPKEFSQDTTLNVVDILMNMLLHIGKEKDDKMITKYMLISREFLYFKGSVKVVKERAAKSKIFPMMIYIMTDKSAMDISKPIAVTPKEKYLYVLCNKDNNIRYMIQREKDNMTRKKPELKNVKAALPTPSGGRVDIVKICEYN